MGDLHPREGPLDRHPLTSSAHARGGHHMGGPRRELLHVRGHALHVLPERLGLVLHPRDLRVLEVDGAQEDYDGADQDDVAVHGDHY